MFCTPGHFLGDTEGVGSRFHALRSRTRFGRYRGRQLPFSSFAHPESFSTVPGASGLVFMFCAPGLFLGCTEGAESGFHVSRSRICFGRYRGHRVPFSSFALPDSFSTVFRASGLVFIFCAPGLFLAVPRASGPVFKFCAPGLVSGGTEGVGYRFHVLRSRTLFGRYRGCRVPFLSFALPDTFFAAPRASGPVFIFCAPRLVFDGTEAVRARFKVFRSWTHFWRYRGRQVPFSCFALPDSFSTVPRPSGLDFMFCAHGIFLGVTVGTGSRFLILRSRTHFDGTEGVGARFHVLRSRPLFVRYRGRWGSFSSFLLPDSFSTIPRPSGLDFMF
jgi:hypothetical protein